MDESVASLLDYAIELYDEDLIGEHIKSVTNGEKSLSDVQAEMLFAGFSPETREMLGKIARNKKTSWFKSVTRMEHIGRHIIGPELTDEKLDAGLREILQDIFGWIDDA